MDSSYKKYEPIFGSWYITKSLGRGSEGELFEICRKDALGHISYSALKIITIPGDEEAQKAVLARGIRREDLEAYYQDVLENNVREYRLMYKLKGNSHIVSYEDHQVIQHENDSGWDILIRLEELTPLIDYVLEHPMSPRDVCRMGADICRGLTFCRKNGIIHRDIKPGNIFLAPSGDFKLGDFGIAQILEYTHIAYSRKGTYTYMAPEVFRGQGYGATVDIYSLGLVMYKYLNDGRSPFLPTYPELFGQDDEELALAKRISGKPMPPPRCGSAGLKEIVLKACSFKPEDRYQSADDMLRDLEEVMRTGEFEDETQSAPAVKSNTAERKAADGAGEAGPGTSARRSPRRSRIALTAVAAVLVCACVAVLVWWRLTPREVSAIEGIADDTKIFIGESLKPAYTIEPEKFADEKMTFFSSDESVFIVDDKGKIAAVGIGEATLLMRVLSFTREVKLTVIPKVTSIENVSKTLRIKVGKRKKLNPVLVPERFSDEKITYRCADPSLARVNTKGSVKALAAGRTTVTIRAGGCSRKVRVIITKPVAKKPALQDNETVQTAVSGNTSGTGYSGGTVYYGGSTVNSGSTGSKSTGSKSKKSGTTNVNGYFDNGADEYFD